MCEFIGSPFGGKGTSKSILLIKGSHTVTILENNLLPTTKRFKGSHTDTVMENNLPPTVKRFEL